MFSNKNFKDRRLRFQQSSFRKELQKARGYKRAVKPGAENRLEEALDAIGLSSWKSRLILFGVIALFVYVVYIPNFLILRNITVTGVSVDEQQNISSLVRSYTGLHKLWPQKNLLLLSTKKLSAYLQKQDASIYAVNAIKKRYFHSLTVAVIPRVESYAIETPESETILYQDGVVSRSAQLLPSSTPISGLTTIKMDDISATQPGQQALDTETLKTITALKSIVKSVTGTVPGYFYLNNEAAIDIDAYSTDGSKLIFDRIPDLDKISKELPLLWSHLSDMQKKSLYYVDMRVPDRGFVCLKNTPCTVDYSNLISTTTPDLLLPSSSPSSTLPTVQNSK